MVEFFLQLNDSMPFLEITYDTYDTNTDIHDLFGNIPVLTDTQSEYVYMSYYWTRHIFKAITISMSNIECMMMQCQRH
jgi:hypothetical protein